MFTSTYKYYFFWTLELHSLWSLELNFHHDFIITDKTQVGSGVDVIRRHFRTDTYVARIFLVHSYNPAQIFFVHSYNPTQVSGHHWTAFHHKRASQSQPAFQTGSGCVEVLGWQTILLIWWLWPVTVATETAVSALPWFSRQHGVCVVFERESARTWQSIC